MGRGRVVAEPLLCVADGHDFGEQLVGLDEQPRAENEREQVRLVRVVVRGGHQVLDQTGQRAGQQDTVPVDQGLEEKTDGKLTNNSRCVSRARGARRCGIRRVAIKRSVGLFRLRFGNGRSTAKVEKRSTSPSNVFAFGRMKNNNCYFFLRLTRSKPISLSKLFNLTRHDAARKSSKIASTRSSFVVQSKFRGKYLDKRVTPDDSNSRCTRG